MYLLFFCVVNFFNKIKITNFLLCWVLVDMEDMNLKCMRITNANLTVNNANSLDSNELTLFTINTNGYRAHTFCIKVD